MVKLFLFLLISIVTFGQQQTLTLTAPSPSSVSNASGTIVGARENGEYYYWLVAKYPIGNSLRFGPVAIKGAANTLSATNYIRLDWNPVVGATGYDVLRTTTANLPTSGVCTCAIALNVTSTTLNDVGLATGIYSVVSASGANANLTLDNLNFLEPTLVIDRALKLYRPLTIPDLTVTNLVGPMVANGSSSVYTPPSIPLQYLRRKPNTTSTTFEFSSPLITKRSDFDFPAQYINNLNAGVANTVMLSPCPLGVNGTDTGHRLFIPTGIAESVLITGGTCVAGAFSGTITFIPTNAHVNPVIESATQGIAEAQQYIKDTSPLGWGEIQLGNNWIVLHATINAIPLTKITFTGSGKSYTTILRAADFTSGALFSNSLSDSQWTLNKFGINQGADNTAGASISLSGGTSHHIYSMEIYSGQYGIIIDGCSYTDIEDITYTNTNIAAVAAAGLFIKGGAVNTVLRNSMFGGLPNALQHGILITGADGVWASNSFFSGNIGILISVSDAAHYVTNVQFIGGGSDSPGTYALAMSGVANVGWGFRFIGSHFHGQYTAGTPTYGTGPVVAMGFGGNANVDGITFVGCLIAGGKVNGVWMGLTGKKNIVFVGNTISDNNRGNNAGTSAIRIENGASGLTMIGNAIYNDSLGHQKYSIETVGTLGDSDITGNSLGSVAGGQVETAPLTLGGALTRVLIKDNQGIDDIGIAQANLAAYLLSDGQTVYCNNCTIANPCAAGGTGAIAKRLNGVNVCN